MATRIRRRPSPVRRAVRSTITGYQRSRAAVGLVAFILVFGTAWIFNGSFTAQKVIELGGDSSWGWALHLAMSAIEVAPIVLAPFMRGLPKTALVLIWSISLPFGIFDVYSSASGVAEWMRWTRLTGLPAAAQNTALGEVLAFLPEPMLVWLITLLHRTLRST